VSIIKVLEQMNFGGYRNFERFMFSYNLKSFFNRSFFSFLVSSDGHRDLADHSWGNYSVF
jgi:hypothetical protein